MRRRAVVYGGLMVVTVVLGLAVRYAPVGLPWVVVKYGASMLWAVMIYWVLCVALPRWRAVSLAVLAVGIATAVELTRLWRFGPLDAFRETLPGVLLLGKYFSVRNIAAYWAAIAIGAMVDAVWVRRWVRE